MSLRTTTNNVSNEKWVRLFLQIEEEEMLQAFAHFSVKNQDYAIDKLAACICQGFMNLKKSPHLKTLAAVRVHLCKQKNANCEKIPPTFGSFKYHALRASHQLWQWVTACEATIDSRDPLECGWEVSSSETFVLATTATELDD